MKKILIVITLGDLGGAQKGALRCAKNYRESGYHATIASGKGEYLREQSERLNIPFRRFHFLKRTTNPLINMLCVAEACFTLSRHRFDAIHLYSSNSLFVGVAAKLVSKNCRVIFTFGGLSMLDTKYGLHLIFRPFVVNIHRLLLLCVDEYIFENHSNKMTAIKQGIVSRGAVNISHIQIEESPVLMSVNESRGFLQDLIGVNLLNKFVIGSVGRLSCQKNYSFLVRSIDSFFAARTNTVFIILGEGPDYRFLIELARSRQIQHVIFFPGLIPEASQYLRGFDLFLLPSLYEGTSNALLESLFAGLPVLASDIPSNAELLNYSKEQLFSLHNRDEFLTKLTRLIKDSTLRAGLARKNILRSKQFLSSYADLKSASYYEKYELFSQDQPR